MLTFSVRPSLTFWNLANAESHKGRVPAQSPGVLRNLMKRFTRVLAVLLIGAVLPVLASNDKAAKALFQKGKAAEVRQDYIAAYNFYRSEERRVGKEGRS